MKSASQGRKRHFMGQVAGADKLHRLRRGFVEIGGQRREELGPLIYANLRE